MAYNQKWENMLFFKRNMLLIYQNMLLFLKTLKYGIIWQKLAKKSIYIISLDIII